MTSLVPGAVCGGRKEGADRQVCRGSAKPPGERWLCASLQWALKTQGWQYRYSQQGNNPIAHLRVVWITLPECPKEEAELFRENVHGIHYWNQSYVLVPVESLLWIGIFTFTVIYERSKKDHLSMAVFAIYSTTREWRSSEGRALGLSTVLHH